MASISSSIELYDRMSAPLMSIMNAVNMTLASMQDMQSTMNADMNTTSLDAARNAANQADMAIQQLNNDMQNMNGTIDVPDHIDVPVNPVMEDTHIETPDPVTVPVQWETNDLEVFNGTGIERFEQEVNSTNQMLNTLSDTQSQIARNAANADVFSDSAVSDLNTMNSRIQAIQTRIQQIENNKVNLGTDQANAQLEQLRGQLNQAVELQNDLNAAVNDMDVERANAAYRQLSATVGNTERFIRDNADAQGRFNQEVQNGVQETNKLVDTVKSLVAAYLTIQTLGKVIDVSDQLVQTQSRIGMMNESFNQTALEAGKTTDELLSTQEVMQMIYASAQNARGSFSDMADVVARFGNNARDAFGSQQEVIAFSNIVQKQMTIAGASTQEASNAMLQLSQALGSGVLRGDELNSIFEQAPNLIQSIADYLDVPIGQIRAMAQEGELTADVVKAAIFASADEVNEKFEQMPMTWGQVWQSMQNSALMAFQPVLERVNELANNEDFQVFVDNMINGMANIAMVALELFDMLAVGAAFVSDNWSVLEPVFIGLASALGIYVAALVLYNTISAISAMVTGIKAAADMMATGATFAATAAQYGFNAALLACPITWIIIAIIAVIALIFAAASAIAKMTGIANSGFGVITGGINVVIQFFKNLGLEVANIALGIGNALAAVASNMMTAFHNAICSVQAWFYDMLSTALNVIAGIAAALNKLPFVEFDYSGITSAANDYAAKSAEAAGNKEKYTSISDAFNEGMNTFDTFQDGWASDAFKSGAAWGDGVADKVSSALDGFGNGVDLTGGVDTSFLTDPSSTQWGDNLGKNAGSTADNTGAIKDSVDISNENLKYLRDAAEQEAINRFTTAEITVNQDISNTISSDTDIDGMISNLTDGVREAMEQAAEGVH